jgi:DNA-binding SARP family transcriptional activator
MEGCAMSEEGNHLLVGVPPLGRVIDRPKLIAEVLEHPSPVTVMAAPGGYGKTTAANQVIHRSGAPAIWLDCSGVEGAESLAVLVRHECAPDAEAPAGTHALLPTQSREECLAYAASMALETLRTPGWLVLDSIPLDDESELLDDILSFLRPLCRAGHRAVITTRACALVNSGGDVAVLDSDSLMLSPAETVVIARLLGVELSERDAGEIHSATNGQVALVLTVLGCARHRPVETVLSGDMGRDLPALVLGLVSSQMGEAGLALFHAAALLRRGRVAQLKRSLGGLRVSLLELATSCVPLLHVEYEHGVPSTFALHDLGVAAFEDAPLPQGRQTAVLESAVRELEIEGRYAECIRVLLRKDCVEHLAGFLEQWGDSILAQGHIGLLRAALESLDPVEFLGRPGLLLLQARILREEAKPTEAVAKATVARDLARADDDRETLAQALETIARASVDMGRLDRAEANLKELLSLGATVTSANARALASSYLALCAAMDGRVDEAIDHVRDAETLAAQLPIDSEVEGRVVSSSTLVIAALLGRVDEALGPVANLLQRPGLSRSLHLQTANNYAHALLEMGRVEQAQTLLEDAEREASNLGLSSLLSSLRVTIVDVQGALGKHTVSADGRGLWAGDSSTQAIDRIGALMNGSMWVRASGDVEGALQMSEECLGLLGESAQALNEWLVILEIAASLLALGDVRAAKKRATSVRRDALKSQAAYHVLRADMILAEVARIEGDTGTAVELLGQHREYILTESSNWQIGMYIRSFPHLLGILGTAIDPDDLPVHLLKLVLPQDAEEALLTAREVMDNETWTRLAQRIVDDADIPGLLEGDGPSECRVEMFGRLSVKVGDRVIADRDWRKGKARTLFAMLVLNCGRDLSRDQILEYLWPDMDEERARNNFYVIWSAMKSALSPEADKNTPCPYADNSAGKCRSVPELVHSDVAEFESLVEQAETSLAAGDKAAAIASYEKLYSIYRGDLLPGDLYEDWFAAARDRYRQDFGDCMLSAGELLLENEDAARALKYVRKALDLDPWREDLYQMALRCQIATGQRSAAVETYFACKDKLGEELGLDPSQETSRLYDQVLAMEADGGVEQGTYGLGAR